jgi:hypothetical protein
MVAAHHREQPPVVRKRSFLDVLHPRPIDADRHLVLALARNSARMTSNALPVIDDESKRRHQLALLRSLTVIRAGNYDNQTVVWQGAAPTQPSAEPTMTTVGTIVYGAISPGNGGNRSAAPYASSHETGIHDSAGWDSSSDVLRARLALCT